MKSEMQDIFEGFVNYVFKDNSIEPIAKERLSICFECPLRDDEFCSKRKEFNGIKGCGCALKLKARSGSKCPLSRW